MDITFLHYNSGMNSSSANKVASPTLSFSSHSTHISYSPSLGLISIQLLHRSQLEQSTSQFSPTFFSQLLHISSSSSSFLLTSSLFFPLTSSLFTFFSFTSSIFSFPLMSELLPFSFTLHSSLSFLRSNSSE